MKTRFYIAIALASVFCGTVMAQTPATTPDNAASPSATCGASTLFPAPANYSATGGVQYGVNNTGTDMCQIFGFTKMVQAMVWDNVTNISGSTITSSVTVSWMIESGTPGSYTFPIPGGETGGFDPDVALFSDANGTYMQVVFENNTTNKIDGYTFKLNGTNTSFALYNPYKSTLYNDVTATKKAKNPNIATSKGIARFAVVWHEEGLVNPPQTLTITYNTNPVQTYSNSIAILESKVFIHSIDKVGYLTSLLGSTSTTPSNAPGVEVIRTAPANSNQLFSRNFNPDVCYGEEVINSNPNQAIASVVFLTQYFNPATFSIVTDQLSVVQGTVDQFRNVPQGTSTVNFTTTYSGKPRIAARQLLQNTVTARDFGVVMGNSTEIISCAGSTQSSKLHFWYVQTGGTIPCPAGGFDLINGTPYATPTVTSVSPVISCVNGRGYYNVVFSTNVNNVNNAFDIVANTFKEGGQLVTPGAFSAVNRGVCTSTSMVGNQVIPSVASFRRAATGNGLNIDSNYLFWDQKNKSVNYKAATLAVIPGGGVALRQMQDDTNHDSTKFLAYPNPTDTEITFDFQLAEKETAQEIEIFNMLGQSVDKFAIEKDLSQQTRDVSKLPAGTYISILKTNTGTQKLQFVRE